MLLEVRNIETSYELSQVLFGVSLSVNSGEVITLMGRNGMGKTTTVHSIMGLCKPHEGEVRLLDHRIDGHAPHQIARMGVGLVPEGRRVFPNLSVRENLVMAYSNRRNELNHWTLGGVLDLFPKLAGRLDHAGNQLSGGEQQMLAIGRALMTNPISWIRYAAKCFHFAAIHEPQRRLHEARRCARGHTRLEGFAYARCGATHARQDR